MNSPYQLTLFDIYQKNALLFSERTAVHWDTGEETFSQLLDNTCRLAAGLGALNLTPGSRIAVLAKNLPAFFHLFGAASRLNLCLVLINRRLSPEEITHVIRDTTPALIICDDEMKEQAQNLVRAEDSLTASYVMDGSLDSLYTDAASLPKAVSGDSAPFVIIHTAAVQGKPRGAVLSQENLILSNLQLIHTFDLGPEKAYLNVLPLFHIMGVNFGLAALMAGGKNVLLDKFNPQKTIDLIREQNISIFGSFPPILTNLYDLIREQDIALPTLTAVVGLEMPEMVQKWESATEATFWTMYGQTETSGLISFSPYFEQPGSAGRLTPLATVAIADDQDNLLAPETVGEILVKGPLVFQGYWQADDLNALTFRQGWHHTGDLGRIDSKGYLHFKGRKAEKELIKPGGENVFPAEVEKAILAHDAVASVCVFGVPDPKFGEGIKAVCTLTPGKSLTPEALISFTGTLIAGYKKPRYVEFVDALPMTADNEIDRLKIKTLYG